MAFANSKKEKKERRQISEERTKIFTMYKQLIKSHNHNHFFTYENAVHESYNTLRGLRCRPIVGIEYPDKDKLCEVDILIINSELINNKVK